jgi:hypothetical protein
MALIAYHQLIAYQQLPFVLIYCFNLFFTSAISFSDGAQTFSP